LPFKSDVGMAELSGAEYGVRSSEMAEVLGGEDLRTLSRLASSGGMLPEGTDLATLAAGFAAFSVGATYSPLDKQVLLVDKFSGDSLLTHEFTHALQDQHFDLMKMLLVRPYNFDRTEAAFAIVEGDATNVQRRAEEGEAYGRRPLDEITRMEGDRFGDYRKEVGALFPPILTETFIFRYRDGARFVETIRRRGGENAVNQLFTNPPVSSEQILHPEKYLQGEMARDVRVDENAFAANGWTATTSTPLGEIGIRGLLMIGISEREAVNAAAGWNGDRAWLFENTGHTPLFVWKTAWNKRADAEEFFKAYNRMLQRKSTPAEGGFTNGDASQAVWREANRVEIVRLTGDTVIVARGSEQDAGGAVEMAQR